MFTETEIADFAKELESYRVERKRSVSDRSKIEEVICAFANDLPGSGKTGVLLVGVDDDGLPSNLPITDQLLQNLAAIRSDGNILPFPQMTVYKAHLRGTAIAVVEVAPSRNTPLRCRGRVWVRVGPRRAIATRDDERILTERRRSLDGPYDRSPVSGVGLEDLDLAHFRDEYLPAAIHPETLAQNQRSVSEQLASLHLASPDAVPNVAGVVMLGVAPTAWIPGAYIQFIRIDGEDLTDPLIDRRELSGPMARVLTRADDLARTHIRVATRVAGTDRETRQADYPIDAIQQLLRNAVMHRNYETSHAPVSWYWFQDRIEIHNPGGLFGRATPDTFGRPGGNDYRNPTIASALAALGFVQKFGMGIPLARRACRDNGNPPPEFAFEARSFGVTLRRA